MLEFDYSLIMPHMQDLYRRIGAKFAPVEPHFKQVIDFINSDPDWESVEEIAYFLATIMHETASTFRPIKEFRATKAGTVKNLQDRYWGSGFYGRGYIQLTWERNYAAFSKILAVDLIKDPNLVLQSDISYKIAAIGMRRGIFTGKKLSDYINDNKTDYVNARRIVNGMDKADMIANQAKRFESILRVSLVQDLGSIEVIDTPSYESIAGGTAASDAPVILEPKKEEKPSGITAWRATLTGILASLGISGASFASLGEKASAYIGPLQNYLPHIILIAFVSSMFLLCVYMVCRFVSVNNERKRSHEILLKELEIRSSPSMYNVEVRR